MARRRRTSRLYWRERGGQRRAYADLRAFGDVGGGQEALIAPGESSATTDQDIAERLLTDRVAELEQRRRNRALLGIEREATLQEFAAHHLVEKARAGKVTEGWLTRAEMHLRAAIDFFGADRDLAAIGVRDVQRYVAHLKRQPSGRGGTLNGGTVRHYLNSLSNMFRRAQGEGCVPLGFNPAGALMEKPSARREEARWLEVPDAALLLEAARTYKPHPEAHGMPYMYPLIATFLLTGGRRAEVLGLEVEDVSFDRKIVTFRPNTWRRLKTATSHRSVPLWPQLEEILREYIFGGSAPPGRLLFPSVRRTAEQMIYDPRKALDAIARRAGWKEGEIRTKAFRHTYCAARLQTVDNGFPVSPYTVGKEMGHGGDQLVRRIYGHLGQVRQRSEAVEYRAEQYRETLGERLVALQAATS
jgi:integrase